MKGCMEVINSHQVIGGRKMPNYWLFLKGSANKSGLAAFVSDTIDAKAQTKLQDDQSVFLLEVSQVLRLLS